MNESSSPSEQKGFKVQEVRYSLLQMLEEVEIERKLSNLGREKVEQTEIQVIFKKKRKRARPKQSEVS